MKKNFLKKLFLIVAALLISKLGFSQKMKVTYDDDTIKVDGAVYAIMAKKTVSPLTYDYSVRSMAGTELIFMKALYRQADRGTIAYNYGSGQEVYYEINFISSGGKAELEHKTGKGFAKMIVENNLIKNNAVDYDAERRFIQVYHGHYPTAEAPASNSAPVVVNINNAPQQASTEPAPSAPPKSKSSVTLSGNEIMRDGSVIGKFRQDTTSSNYSEKQIMITIYSEGGDKVAEAHAPVISPKEWYIKTISDGKNFSIMYDSPGEREKLFRYLADKNYLVY